MKKKLLILSFLLILTNIKAQAGIKTEIYKPQAVNVILISGIIFLVIFTGLFIYYKKKSSQVKTRQKEPVPEIIFLPAKEKRTIDSELNNVIELAKNNDKSFHIKFSELFPEFNQKLLEVNPQLTHSDLEYCALIKLKFDTKEIAIYKNTSISSVESKKYRIRKKLCIRTDENMYTWMINI
ncbi:helix-turn-helix transcriptional regulator [Epilithonimonas pallida]|uniref:HTH luxR-type domain-containing protein n=1 Tax=Epilithonimonas pallida TaxID=373671 RepID=A0ABY1R1M5_9FLAO|nr:hypothetical protein [Epilithonimonas pallida]SMP91278.1 hypothetical protein SAMN05421679_1032 [Epilithonimonas pallida]